jgi:Uma2 family endonuclease
MAMPIAVPRYTVDDLAAWPDDGNRYELLDGVLLVTPSPALPHQVVATRIAAALTEFTARSPGILVSAPGVVTAPPTTELQPDILVFRRPAQGDRWTGVTEYLLAVEVESPSSRIYDREFKRLAYQALGVRTVWRVVIDARTVYVTEAGSNDEVARLDQVAWAPDELAEPFSLSFDALLTDIEPGQ